MAIRSVDSPNAARDAVLEGMRRRSAGRGFWTPNLKNANPNSLQLCQAHRVAFLSLPDVRPNASLRAVTMILGWRFLIFVKPIKPKDDPIAAAHSVLAENGQYRLSELNEGEFVKGTHVAFDHVPAAVDAAPKGIDRDPLEEINPLEEILLLFAPSVYFVGLWARYQREDADIVLPVEPTSQDLHPFIRTPIPTAKLLAILYDAAKRVPNDSASAG